MEKVTVEKTYVLKGQDIQRDWLIVDAAGQNLGRLATKIAHLLLGKNKPTYTPGVAMGDFVIVINARAVEVYPERLTEKFYYRHSNYPGGLKKINLRDQLAKYPDRVIRAAVWGMLPKNKMTRQLIKNLKIYGEAEHPHHGQTPTPVA